MSLLSLICLVTYSYADISSNPPLFDVLPQASRLVRRLQPIPYYEGYESNGEFVGIAFITTEICPEKAQGYQSRISTLVGVDARGKITGVRILEQTESLGRKTGELEGHFIKQFIGKNVKDPLILGVDVDAITGATVTSSAVANSIREGLYIISTKVLLLSDLSSKEDRAPTSSKEDRAPTSSKEDRAPTTKSITLPRFFRLDIVLLFFMALLVFIGYRENSNLIRYFVFVISIVYLGIWKGGGISIIDINNILNLNFPSIMDNLYWVSLILLALGLTIFAGRMYCGWFCPFGAVLELLSHIGPKYSIPPGLDSYLKGVKYIFLLILVLLAINLNRLDLSISLANIIEPFETFWQIHGNLFAWNWLILVVALSFFIPRFFCRYLCPLGALFALITMVASWLRLTKIKIRLPGKEECKGCKIALQACSVNALSYNEKTKEPRIDDSECIKCNECRLSCPKCEVYLSSSLQ